MKNVVWLSVDPEIPAQGYWDQTLLAELLKDCNWVVTLDGLLDLTFDSAIVIIPGASMGKHIDKINAELAKITRVKVIITSDEENKFPIDSLSHINMKIYATYMTDKYTTDIHWLPIGPAKIVERTKVNKRLDWVFAGQVNHGSREQLIKVLNRVLGNRSHSIVESAGFAQGLSQNDYYKLIEQARVMPAPRGNVSPDSFRLYEALEAGAVPIPENTQWWAKLFNMELPFPVVDNWDDLPKEFEQVMRNPNAGNESMAWWQRMKLDIKYELTEYEEPITVVIPVSAIKSHPSTEIIDETISTVRHHLPKSKIIVTFDGIRAENAEKTEKYREFIENFLIKYNNSGIYPIIFKDHTHQVGMLREALKHVNSEFILYVEQDTPLTPDRNIEWSKCLNVLADGQYDLIRFHFEEIIPEPHKYLMIGEIENGFLKTAQWSQRPHLTSKSFYERILRENFSEYAKSFIEDKMHGVVAEAYQNYGLTGWYGYRLAIYAEREDFLKRSYHTDGRAGEDKFDDTQVY